MSDKPVMIITGSSGRIGTSVIERFKEKYSIIGLDAVPPAKQDGFEYIKIDLGSPENVNQAFNRIQSKYGNRIASVVHLAAYYNFTGGEWAMYEKITVKGTESLLLALKPFTVEQFLFSSTMLVHAPTQPNVPITEDSPLLASWEYPKSKIMTEEAIHTLGQNIPTVILRIAGVYDDYCNSIPISNQIQRIYEKQMIAHLYPGDKTHGSSFLHMDDLVDAIALSVEKRKELPQHTVFLIGETEVLDYATLQNTISKLIYGKDMATIWVPKWFAKFGAWAQNHTPLMPPSFVKPWMIDLADYDYELDTSHAEQLLGWHEQHTLRATLPKMIEALKKDPVAWYKHHKLQMPKGMCKEAKSSCCSGKKTCNKK